MFDLDLKLIKPKNISKSDKYSSNLYKIMNKIKGEHKSLGRTVSNKPKIYFANCHIGWSTEYVGFHENIHKELNIFDYIAIAPYGNPSSGYFLGDILRRGGRSEHWSFCVYDTSKWIDVTEWFWNNYIRMGRCFFDKDHYGFMQNTEGRYYEINKNHRKCKWCGEHFKREIKKKVKIERIEKWTPVEPLKIKG